MFVAAGCDGEVNAKCLRCGDFLELDFGYWNGVEGGVPKDGNDVVEWMTAHNKSNCMDKADCA